MKTTTVVENSIQVLCYIYKAAELRVCPLQMK